MVQFNKYNESGSYHWKKIDGSIFSFSPRLNARYDLVVKFITDYVKGSNLKGLDIGCGDGVLLYKLAQKNIDIIGLEYEQSGVDLARSILDKKGLTDIKVQQGDCYNLEFEDNTFDIVTSVEVIEHLEDVEKYLSEIKRVLKPNGIFVCTTPQRDYNKPSDYVRDPYHVKEYFANELKEEIHSFFQNTTVYGAFPIDVDRNYLSFSNNGFVNNLHKLLIKIKSKMGVNPFMKSITENPSYDYDQLISVSIKK